MTALNGTRMARQYAVSVTGGRDTDLIEAGINGPSWDATPTWVEKGLPEGDRIEHTERLRGGWTSEMRRLHIIGPRGERSLVLRSFVKPFYLQHAEGLLTREADI